MREICHHDGGVELALRHLVEVNEDFGVARSEIDVLTEEHRCVAVAVEGKDTGMELLGCLE